MAEIELLVFEKYQFEYLPKWKEISLFWNCKRPDTDLRNKNERISHGNIFNNWERFDADSDGREKAYRFVE